MLELIDTTHSFLQVCDDNVGCNEVKNVMYDYHTDLVCILFYDHIVTFFYIFKKSFLLPVCILFSDILNDLCTSLCQYYIHYAQVFIFFVGLLQFGAISSALTLTTQWPLLIYHFVKTQKL